MTQHVAQQWATYNGRMTHMVGEVVGPNMLDEYLTCVEVTYNPQTNKTRAGFAYGILKFADEPEE